MHSGGGLRPGNDVHTMQPKGGRMKKPLFAISGSLSMYILLLYGCTVSFACDEALP